MMEAARFEACRKRLREGYEKIPLEKAAKSIRVLSLADCPQPQTAMVNRKIICQAVTMAGKPCPFKATSSCGKFCKKHNITT